MVRFTCLRTCTDFVRPCSDCRADVGAGTDSQRWSYSNAPAPKSPYRYWERSESMSVHLVNPSDNSFGTAVITPRWLFVLAAATPQAAGDPILVDESLEQIVPESIMPGDIVGISVHTGNALRGYEVGRMARERGAWVVYGGIHATLYPEEAFERGDAHAVVKGDGDIAWGKVVTDCLAGKPEQDL